MRGCVASPPPLRPSSSLPQAAPSLGQGIGGTMGGDRVPLKVYHNCGMQVEDQHDPRKGSNCANPTSRWSKTCATWGRVAIVTRVLEEGQHRQSRAPAVRVGSKLVSLILFEYLMPVPTTRHMGRWGISPEQHQTVAGLASETRCLGEAHFCNPM